MIFRNGEVKLLWPFYLSFLIMGLTSVIAPYLIIYLKSVGFSFTQIGAMVAVSGIAMVLFEIPTGAFADNFSRKNSTILGFCILAVSVVLIPFTQSFVLVMFCWAMAGVGVTFISGADEAWVIDNLNKNKRKDLHQEYFIKIQSIASFGAILAPLLAALIISMWSMAALWYVFGAGFALCALSLSFAPELYKPKNKGFGKAILDTWSTTKKAAGFAVVKKPVLYLIIGTALVALSNMGEIGVQPLLEIFGMPLTQIGIFYSIMSACMFISVFAIRAIKKWSVRKGLIITTLIRLLFFAAIVFVSPGQYMLVALLYLLSNIAFNFEYPLVAMALHTQVPTKIRATMTSLLSMSRQTAIALSAFIGGLVMDGIGIQLTIFLGAMLGLSSISFFRRIQTKKIKN